MSSWPKLDRIGRERTEAFRWVDSLSSRDLGELGDALVLGEYDWRDWFNEKPSRAFMSAVEERRIYREIMDPH